MFPWFHLAKVYSSTEGCIGFWCIRHVHGKDKKTGKEWKLVDNKIALCFPLFIFSLPALVANVAVIVYAIMKVTKTKRNPYKGELYSDLKEYIMIKEMAE